MKTTEIRVRPVIRHVITKFVQEENGASSSPMGEFPNEAYAEEVADALRQKHAAREFVIVEQTMGEKLALVTYAYSEEEALERMAAEKAETGKVYRMFSRIRELLPAN